MAPLRTLPYSPTRHLSYPSPQSSPTRTRRWNSRTASSLSLISYVPARLSQPPTRAHVAGAFPQGADKIWRLSKAANGSFGITGSIDQPAGSGPRHIAVVGMPISYIPPGDDLQRSCVQRLAGDLLFTLHELSSTLTAQNLSAADPSALLSNLTTIPSTASPTAKFGAAEILIPPPSSQFPGTLIYCSNRFVTADARSPVVMLTFPVLQEHQPRPEGCRPRRRHHCDILRRRAGEAHVRPLPLPLFPLRLNHNTCILGWRNRFRRASPSRAGSPSPAAAPRTAPQVPRTRAPSRSAAPAPRSSSPSAARAGPRASRSSAGRREGGIWSRWRGRRPCRRGRASCGYRRVALVGV